MAYSDEQKKEIIDNICLRVVDELISFNKAVSDSPITLTTFYVWIKESIEFQNSYNYAREIRSDVLFEEIIDIADTQEEGTVTIEKPTGIEIKTGDMEGHRRLRIDARKWAVAKMNPKKYGDKIEVNSNVKVNERPKIEFNDD